MKIRLLVLFVLFFVKLGFSQEKKCSDLKTGTFVYSNPIFKKFKVVRKKTIQIETDTTTGMSMEGAIEWKSDCEYILTYTKVPTKAHEKILGEKVYVQIVSVLGNKILCKTKAFGVAMDLEMIKIED